MNLKAVIGAAGLGLVALAACDSAKEEAVAPIENPEPPIPADADRTGPFAQALNFTCADGSTLDAVIPYGAEGRALVRIDGAEPFELPVVETNEPQTEALMTFRDADRTLEYKFDTVTYVAGGNSRSCTFVSRSLPPPAIEGVVMDVQGSQAGSTIDLKVGEKFSVSLSGVPTAGYMWGAEALPEFLSPAGEAGGSTSTSQFQPGFAGGNHWEVLAFEAKAPGQGELVLVQRRPWEDKGSPDDQRFKLTVRVQ